MNARATLEMGGRLSGGALLPGLQSGAAIE
jgi:hypothetical protein